MRGPTPVSNSGGKWSSGMANRSNAWAGSFALLFLVSATPLFSQNSTCQLNFEESRSASGKKVLETHQEFTILDVTTALRRLQAQLPGAGVTILGVDIENGVIRGESSMPNVAPFPVVVTVTAIPFGTRVRFRAEPSAGMIVDEGTKDTICEMLRLANVEAPAQVPSRSPVAPRATEGTLTNDDVIPSDLRKQLEQLKQRVLVLERALATLTAELHSVQKSPPPEPISRGRGELTREEAARLILTELKTLEYGGFVISDVKVTGLQRASETEITAPYTYSFAGGGGRVGRATLELYDDGWRVSQLGVRN